MPQPTTAAEAKALYLAKLNEHGYTENTPGYKIITRPGKELWTHFNNSQKLVEKLHKNFHEFGQTNSWVWQETKGENGSDQLGTLGKPLLLGAIQATNCGSFNAGVRQLAKNILGISEIKSAFTTTHFVTKTNCAGIDPNWLGNVSTLTHKASEVKAYCFTAHGYNQYNGILYDGSTKSIGFQRDEDLFWGTCKTPIGASTDVKLFTVLDPTFTIPGNAPYYIFKRSVLLKYKHLFPNVGAMTQTAIPGSNKMFTHKVGASNFPKGPASKTVSQNFITTMDPQSGAGWSSWLLVSADHLPAEFKTAMKI